MVHIKQCLQTCLWLQQHRSPNYIHALIDFYMWLARSVSYHVMNKSSTYSSYSNFLSSTVLYVAAAMLLCAHHELQFYDLCHLSRLSFSLWISYVGECVCVWACTTWSVVSNTQGNLLILTCKAFLFFYIEERIWGRKWSEEEYD